MNESYSSASRPMLNFTYAVGFVFGLVLCFDSVFMPEFKEHFHLDYTSQMYILFAKNIPFIIFSMLLGYLTKWIGFKNCLGVSLVFFSIGTFLLVPGLRGGDFRVILLAFFINGLAFNCELVSWNPLLSALGDPAGSSARLNLGNALGAIAQIVAPLIILFVIPASVVSLGEKLPVLEGLFSVLAVLLLIFSLVTFFIKSPKLRFERGEVRTDGEGAVEAGETGKEGKAERKDVKAVWKNVRLLRAFLALFLVLGVEAGIFGLYRNFLEDPRILGCTSHQSQTMFMIYFALFALGRVVAWQLQKRMSPVLYTTVNLLAAVLLFCGAVFLSHGAAVFSLTAAGFFISTLFPSLYAMAIRGLGEQTGLGSGMLSMGMLGAAVLPVGQGWLADHCGIQHSFMLVFVPYLYTFYYLWTEYKGMGKKRSAE